MIDMLSSFVATSTIAQTHKDRRLGTFDGEIGDIYILEHTAIHNLKRDGRRANPLSEELLLLIVTGLYHDATDIDISEASISLGTQFNGIAMTRYHTIADTHVFAKTGRGALQRNTIVIAISYHAAYNHLMAAVDIQRIVIIVITIKNLDSIDIQAVASQVVLHPATRIAQGNTTHQDVLTLDKANQMRTGDSLIVPRKFLKGPSTTIYDTQAVNRYVVHAIGINQLDGSSLRSKRQIVRFHRYIILQSGTAIERGSLFQIQVYMTL